MELTNEQVRIIAKEMGDAVERAIVNLYNNDSPYGESLIYNAIKSGVKEILEVDFDNARRCRSNLMFDAVKAGVEDIVGSNLVSNNDTVARAIETGTSEALRKE